MYMNINKNIPRIRLDNAPCLQAPNPHTELGRDQTMLSTKTVAKTVIPNTISTINRVDTSAEMAEINPPPRISLPSLWSRSRTTELWLLTK